MSIVKKYYILGIGESFQTLYYLWSMNNEHEGINIICKFERAYLKTQL